MLHKLRAAAGLLLLAGLALPARAEGPPSPLRLMPDQADLLIEIKNPQRLVETLTALDAVEKLRQFPSVKEILNGTTYKRFYQLVAHFEKEMGAKRSEILDRVAGGGMALGVKFGPDPAPSLLVVQGKAEKQVRKFVEVALAVLEQELARQESKEKPVHGSYQGIATIQIGPQFHAAVAGSAILISNRAETLHAGLDLHLGAAKEKKSLADVASIAEAAKLLPPDPLLNVWVTMDRAKESAQFREMFLSNAPLTTIVNGSFVDALKRSNFVCGGLFRDNGGLLLAARLPAGREGMGPVQTVHLPPAGQPGSRPLLAPKGVLYSESFYLDPARIWQDRGYLFDEPTVKSMEEFDKNSGRLLSGLQISKLLTEAGPYHRVVAVNQSTNPYKTTPKIQIPAFAVVSELRDPEPFAKNMETVFRGLGLLASSQVKLDFDEATYKDCNVISWRFPVDGEFKADVSDIRFNFSPCFTRVGNQFVVCSTVELCHELIDVLQQEAKDKPSGSASTRQARAYAAGVADVVAAFQDTLVTQTVLDQAVPPGEAKAQVAEFLQWIRDLGDVDLDQGFTAKEFHINFRFNLK
jgi:hypothetical protein